MCSENDFLNLRKINDIFKYDFSIISKNQFFMVYLKAILQTKCVELHIDNFKIVEIMNYYSDFHYMIKTNNLDNEVEKKMFKELNLPNNLKCYGKNDLVAILKAILNEYHRQLNHEIRSYNKEELFIFFYTCASNLSCITTSSLTLSKSEIKEDEIDISILNENIDLSKMIIHKNPIEYSRIIGNEKIKLNYILNYLLCSGLDHQNKNFNEINLQKIFSILEHIVKCFFYLEYSKHINENESLIFISNDSIILNEDIKKIINNYFENYSFQEMTYNDNLNLLMEEFKKNNKYNPDMLLSYFVSESMKYDFSIEVMLIEKELLIKNMGEALKLERNVILTILNNFKFKIVNHNQLEKVVIDKDKTIYKRPLIQINNFIIISRSLMLEAIILLQKRILKNDIEFINGKFNNMKKILYDEINLTLLNKLINENNITGSINFSIEINDLKQLNLKKGETKEIDFYMIKSGVLYIMELKNWNSNNNMVDCIKSKNKAFKIIRKLKNLKQRINENKVLFVKAFGKDFDEIQIFLTFRYPVYCINDISDPDISLCLFSDFYEMIKNKIKQSD